jgi:hypothetical protein
MKKPALFISILTLLSALSGYLLSKASLTGRVGISLFYKEYGFLKTWWLGGITVLAVLLLLFLLQGYAERKFSRRKAAMLHIIMVILAFAGLCFTYYDFRHTLSHHLLGGRFHLGAYLFWVGWILISLFYLTQKKPAPAEA